MGRWANKYVIGLTGNIAMGKSLVRKMLEHLGAYTLDADGLAHQVMAPGAPAYGPVIDTFGKWILDGEGRVDRNKLGAVVFSHPEALTRLEALTHPIVSQGIDTLINLSKRPIVVIEAIKLLETVLGEQVDTIWVVDSAAQIQLERLITRRGMSEFEARKRIESQNSQRDKLARASVVITNNGNAQDVWVQVEREWNRITGQRAPVPPAQPAQPAPAAAPKVATGTLPVVQKTATQPMPAAQPQTPVQPAPRPAAVPVAQQPVVSRSATGPMPAVQVPAQQAAQQPPAQRFPAQAPAPQPPVQPAPVGAPLQISHVETRRGMPKNAEEIARLINRATGKNLTRMDIMMAFGEKSYLLAEADGRAIGLAGFQVENLITRMDEFWVIPEAPLPLVAQALIQAVEDASKELQSEVGFMFLPQNAGPLAQVFADQGYERTQLESIKVPAWREAAAESQPPNTQIFAKKLRAERVLKPL